MCLLRLDKSILASILGFLDHDSLRDAALSCNLMREVSQEVDERVYDATVHAKSKSREAKRQFKVILFFSFTKFSDYSSKLNVYRLGTLMESIVPKIPNSKKDSTEV